jgi:hypothetical protein
MPPHILPIPSRRNKYGYHGVTNRDRKMTKFSCVVYMDAKAVRLGPYDSAEDASKMFGKFIPVEVRSRLFSKP